MSQSNRNTLQSRAVLTVNHTGKRPCQEDHILLDQDRGIFVVTDGFGGPVAGKEAAKQGSEAVKNFLYREAGDMDATLPFVLRQYYSLVGNVLFNALVYANRKLLQLNKNKNVHEKGGASVISGYIDGDLLAIASLGVCSGWLFREGKKAQLTIPRSFRQLLDPFNDKNQDSKESLQAVPLTALGISEDMEPEILEYKLMPGDWLLFQTDGIQNEVHEEILRVKSKNVTVEDALKSIKDYTNSQNYLDNASFLLAIF